MICFMMTTVDCLKPYKPNTHFMGHMQTVPNHKTPQDVASNLILHCLLTQCIFKIWMKLLITSQQPLNL